MVGWFRLGLARRRRRYTADGGGLEPHSDAVEIRAYAAGLQPGALRDV